MKATAGLGAALVLPVACGNDDVEIFAGAVADPSPARAVPLQIPTTAPVTPVPTGVPISEEPTTVPTVPAEAPPATAVPTATPVPTVAVAGELIVSFTYTQGFGGRNERPYIAVWVENEAGELAQTISLWYEQGRRGERWLDHLDRWWERDQSRIFGGGINDVVTISSATRQPGSYSVAWDGTVDGVAASAGPYYICIEAAREEGPHSLIREPITLAGTLPQIALPDVGELSAASVRIDV